jgi:hypothetical protein
VIRELKQSGITQADLGRRLGKAPEVISRLLARPQNWESDTFCDLLFAISGAVASYRADHPLNRQSQGLVDLSSVAPISFATRGSLLVDATVLADIQTGTGNAPYSMAA